MKHLKYIVVVFFSLLFVNCNNEDPTPKPKAFLRLEYPKPIYELSNPDLPFTFEKNTLADKVTKVEVSRDGKTKGINIVYPKLKGTIFLTYKSIDKPETLRNYLVDAQKITLTHTQKADEIDANVFENTEHNVFGMFYEVGGNAASQSQFYVTDSINHFLNGSLYFYAKPNYDSILPAADYLKNDIKTIMETVRWK